jgi:hypothetical protein
MEAVGGPPLEGRPSWVGRLGRVRERLFTTMNASARIETRAEVDSEVHFSHDGLGLGD